VMQIIGHPRSKVRDWAGSSLKRAVDATDGLV
jgi:hypothetical protein